MHGPLKFNKLMTFQVDFDKVLLMNILANKVNILFIETRIEIELFDIEI